MTCLNSQGKIESRGPLHSLYINRSHSPPPYSRFRTNINIFFTMRNIFKFYFSIWHCLWPSTVAIIIIGPTLVDKIRRFCTLLTVFSTVLGELMSHYIYNSIPASSRGYRLLTGSCFEIPAKQRVTCWKGLGEAKDYNSLGLFLDTSGSSSNRLSKNSALMFAFLGLFLRTCNTSCI